MADDRPSTGRHQVTASASASTSWGTNPVGEFFDEQLDTDGYSALKARTRELDAAAARLVGRTVDGDVLSIGGVWDWFEWGPAIRSLTVLDISARMLDSYCPPGATRVEGDLFEVAFPPGRFDTVVFPLVLHHTPRDDWRTSERRIRDALARAAEWLRPGGTVVIVEYCAQTIWAVAQRVALPVTKRFLRRVGQPLVIMQSRGFYENALAERFHSVAAQRVEADGFDYWKWYPVFMGVPWLRVPFVVYPRLHVLTGTTDLRSDGDHAPSTRASQRGDGVGG
jgi:Methyltransferase domain